MSDLPRGPVPGGTLFRLWGPGFKHVVLGNDEDVWICTGSCNVRGPLWVHLSGVEWEDITCPDCITFIDSGKWEV